MDEVSYFAPIRRLFLVQARLVQAALGAILGCAFYFYAPIEPAVWVWIGLLLLAAVGGWFLKSWRVGVLFTVLFFGWSQFWLHSKMDVREDTEFVEGRYWVTGRLIEMTPSDKRIKMRLSEVEVFGRDVVVDKIQVSIAKSRWPEGLSVGHGVAAQVFLQPVALPRFAGDYDGRLRALVGGVSAYGFVMGDFDATYLPHKVNRVERWLKEFGYGVERLRQRIAIRMQERADGVVAALLVGKRGFLNDEVWDDFRESGLAHLLAISGMHVGFMAGGLFFLVRFLIACVPSAALRVNGKWVGAFVGSFAAVGYMLLAGATLPTVRAALMLGLLFLAVLVGRQRLLLRALGLAVLLVLFLWPWSVVTASFQLSFVAALALGVWFYGYEVRERERFRAQGGVRYIQLVFLSSLVAGLVTLPLTIAHFGMASLSGLAANMVAIPLTAFWLMPAALGVFLTLPLGVSLPFEMLLGAGAEILVWWAALTAGWPLAGLRLPAWSAGVVLLPVGIVLYYTYVERLRVACVWFGVLIGLLLSLPLLQSEADIYILDNGGVLLALEEEGYKVVWPQKITKEQARLIDKFVERRRITILSGAHETSECDDRGCVLSLGDVNILVGRDYISGEACGLVDAVILPPDINSCAEKRLVVEASSSLWVRGGDVFVSAFSPRRTRVWE